LGIQGAVFPITEMGKMPIFHLSGTSGLLSSGTFLYFVLLFYVFVAATLYVSMSGKYQLVTYLKLQIFEEGK